MSEPLQQHPLGKLLPDYPEREILLRQCALAVAHQMSIIGYSVEEGQE